MPRLRFAGQITGCEGYVESAAIGLLAGRFAAAERLGAVRRRRRTTALGALSATSPAAISRRSTKAGAPSSR
jgi:methylenetetrahydrofolate--tRNA-(uracil-5-)-methyltransferase